MTVITKAGRKYDFYVDDAKQFRVNGTPRELVVTDLLNLMVGEHLTIKGYLLNPLTLSPQTGLGKFTYTTSTISNIIP